MSIFFTCIIAARARDAAAAPGSLNSRGKTSGTAPPDAMTPSKDVDALGLRNREFTAPAGHRPASFVQLLPSGLQMS